MNPLALLSLLRPANLLGLWGATEAGARLSGGPALSAAALVPCLVAAFGYARNDAVDQRADARNRPGRPVPSGRITPRAAALAGWLLLGAGGLLLLAMNLGPRHVVAFGAAAVALYAYSPWMKGWGIGSPLLIALLSALAIGWGGWLGAEPGRVAAASFLAAAATFARECAKDLEDLAGDRAEGRRTWPVRAGSRTVEKGLRIGAALALISLPLPWLRGDAGPAYLAVAGIGAPGLAWAALRTRPFDPDAARRVSLVLKAAIFAGIAGLLLGAGR